MDSDCGLAALPSRTCTASLFRGLTKTASSVSVGFKRTSVPLTTVPGSVSIHVVVFPFGETTKL